MGEWEIWIAGIILISLTLYALGAGADFGGGVWDLFAGGRRAREQRRLIEQAIGPIWEANHVWLILAIVLMFVAFPTAYSAISTALHIPLALLLIGIVLRGSAFTFRSHDDPRDDIQKRWSRIFAVASVISPLMLGVCIGAIASGRIRGDPETGRITPDFFSSWLAPFPWAIGIFTLCLFAFLAAVYLSVEASDPDLKNDFRLRALASAVAVGIMAAISFILSKHGAPEIRRGLAHSTWAIPFQLITAFVAVAAISALARRRFNQARILAIVQVTLVIWGWGLAQFPYILEPDLTFYNCAAPNNVLKLLLIALGAGALVLFPSLGILFMIFKKPTPSGK